MRFPLDAKYLRSEQSSDFGRATTNELNSHPLRGYLQKVTAEGFTFLVRLMFAVLFGIFIFLLECPVGSGVLLILPRCFSFF